MRIIAGVAVTTSSPSSITSAGLPLAAITASAAGAADAVIAASGSPAEVIDDGDDVVTATPAIIRKVQQALVNAGFNPGPVDGVSGAKTVSAIENFQKQNGIPVGKLTKKTLRALGVKF